MPIDIALLATTAVTSFLLPYIKDGAKKIADALTEKGSKAGAEYFSEVAKKAWDRVKSSFSSEDDKTELSQFESSPEEKAPLIEDMLKVKLRKDPLLAEELDKLVNTPGPDGKSASLLIKNVVGDVGVLYMPNAKVRGHDIRLAGVMKEYKGNQSEERHSAPGTDPTKVPKTS
jgi:hypothetical protein